MTTSPRMMLEGTPRRAPRAPVAHVEVVDGEDAPEPVVVSPVVPARSPEPVAARREAVVTRPEPVAARGGAAAAGGAPSFVVHAPAARRPEAVDELDDADEDTDGSVDPVDEWESSEDDSLPGVRAASPSDEVKVGAAEGLQRTVRDDGRAVSDQANLFFELPPLSLLDPVPEQRATIDEEDLRRLAVTVEESLASFKVTGKVQNVRVGPVVTTFEFLPDTGISVRRISALQDDLAMALRAISVRVVAPIPGKGVVGIEIPSAQRMTIYLRELLASEEFRTFQAALPVILGKDVEGRPLVADLARMPHLLVGGTTGSGKSVGVNGMLMSLLYRRTPEELRLLLVDPKKLEFESYADVPHLLHPVVTEPKAAAAALAWACREMDRRYELLARWGTRNIANYNKKVEREVKTWSRDKAQQYAPKDWPDDVPPPKPELLPYIVIVIDELADLMMVARKDVEGSVVRLAQMARACGMHLVVATQRPSVDVITGLIKSNLPTRVSFKLRSVIDSRTILDQGGAEKLLGQGDMLHLPGSGEIQRAHGPFVSDDEVSRVIDFLKAQREPDYIDAITADDDGAESEVEPESEDDLYSEAVAIVMKHGKASTSMIQRHLKIGYNRAARIVDLMEMAGVVGPADGARPREVIGGHHG
jgi:S-DNA-T family DNA segregation ATPase FtsK/SpoIIIE